MNPNDTHKVIVTALIVVLLVAVTIMVFVVGIYKFRWDNIVTRQFISLVPLPAAMVNARFVTLKEFADYQTTFQKLPNRGLAPAEQRLVLSNLVENEIIADLARRYAVVVTGEELDRYFSYLLTEFNLSPAGAAAEIEGMFGISKDKFKKLFVLPDLVRSELKVEVNEKSPLYREAQNVLEELRRGLEFAKAVERYSQDETSKYLGGDLGFFTKDDLNPWLAKAATDLKVGEISPVVISPDGYHILYISGRNDELEPPSFQVRQIFFKGPDFAEFFEKQKQNYRVYKFLRYSRIIVET